MGRFDHRLWNRLAAALGVLALALAGFAHRPGDTAPDPQIAAYLALGGTLHDLCLSEDTGGHGGHEGQLAECPACTLGKAMALAAAAGGPAAPLACRAARSVWPSTAALPHVVLHLPEARAPPFERMI